MVLSDSEVKTLDEAYGIIQRDLTNYTNPEFSSLARRAAGDPLGPKFYASSLKDAVDVKRAQIVAERGAEGAWTQCTVTPEAVNAALRGQLDVNMDLKYLYDAKCLPTVFSRLEPEQYQKWYQKEWNKEQKKNPDVPKETRTARGSRHAHSIGSSLKDLTRSAASLTSFAKWGKTADESRGRDVNERTPLLQRDSSSPMRSSAAARGNSPSGPVR